MVRSKKSMGLLLVWIAALSTPHESKAFMVSPISLFASPLLQCNIIAAPAALLAFYYSLFARFNRYSKATDIAHTQDEIAQYTAKVSIYGPGEYKTRTIQTITTHNPLNMINSLISLSQQHGAKGKKFRANIQLTLTNGKTYAMRYIEVNSLKTAALEKYLYKRLIVPGKNRLTYNQKIWLSVIPMVPAMPFTINPLGLAVMLPILLV